MATARPSDGSLRWLKLRGMPVFWPACVYASYSSAVAHTHEVREFREAKPALDREDRVVYFFGVGPRAFRVHAAGSAPNLQLCVAHEDDVTSAGFVNSKDFGRLCRDHGVVEEDIMRAEHNACFKRACDEATAFAADVSTDEEAATFFVNLLRRAIRDPSKGSALEESFAASATSSPASTNGTLSNPSQPKQRPATIQTSVESEDTAPSDVSHVLASPKLEGLVAKCWQMMIKEGWETMTQGDGQVLYKMSGISFFDFRPNLNIFDSLENACAKYLQDWVKSVADNSSSDESSEAVLTEFLWPLASECGWMTMSSANETWYIVPNTPFDKCVPNETIFRSKTQAVAKFLEESGLGMEHDQDSYVDEQDDESGEETSDDTEAVDDVDSEGQDDSQEEESEVASDENDDEESDEDMADDVEEPQSRVLPASQSSKRAPSLSTSTTTVRHSNVSTKPVKKVSAKKASIPKFECTFGKTEAELKRRGWYWRSGSLAWQYYQPHCKGKKDSALEAGKDYFIGREELEIYLEDSGLQDEISAHLLLEHQRSFAVSSDSEDEEEDEEEEEEETQVIAEPLPNQKKNRTNNRPTSKATKPKARRNLDVASSNRKRQRSRSSNAAADVKFGDVWAILRDEGWHYAPGKLEYDYFKPHCKTAADGEALVDYFPSKMLLIDYLHSSGIWDRAANQLAEEESDEDMSEDEVVVEEPVVEKSHKRKAPTSDSTERGGSSTDNLAKRQKPGNSLRTPLGKLSLVGSTTTPANARNANQGETISPDAANAKDAEHGAAPTSARPRKLADVFTPSPSNIKKVKNVHRSVTKSADENVETRLAALQEKDPASAAIRRLTASYTPRTFRYRENEFAEIRGFFRHCFMQRRGASLYISGAPGCGKTALLKSTEPEINDLFKECCHKDNAKLARLHVNAMSLSDVGSLYCQIAEAVTQTVFDDGEAAFKAIERTTNTASTTKRPTTVVLVLDEIDTLLKRNGVESDLCRLFELAHNPSHSFVFVGIANQVDFTERHLPLLKARLPNCRPKVLVFQAYTHQTIEQILVDRLGGKAEAAKLVNAHGISYLARKIASTTGDIRRALDTCRRILQFKVESSDKENVENRGEDSDAAQPLPLTDMLRLIKHALESKSSQVVQSLPRNLQMILFAASRLVRSSNTVLGVNELYASYCDVSERAGVLRPLASREFRNALDVLGAEGVVGPAELKRQLVKPLLSASDLQQSFKADAFFSRLM